MTGQHGLGNGECRQSSSGMLSEFAKKYISLDPADVLLVEELLEDYYLAVSARPQTNQTEREARWRSIIIIKHHRGQLGLDVERAVSRQHADRALYILRLL